MEVSSDEKVGDEGFDEEHRSRSKEAETISGVSGGGAHSRAVDGDSSRLRRVTLKWRRDDKGDAETEPPMTLVRDGNGGSVMLVEEGHGCCRVRRRFVLVALGGC